MIDAREIAFRAAKLEYCIVFPQYYFGQIYKAMNHPGTIAYSPKLVWNLLEETCNELSRNGHGGNINFLNYFCQVQLASKKDYAVILASREMDSIANEKILSLRKTKTGGHADEVETSMMYSHRPDLVDLEKRDDAIIELQNEFFNDAKNPIKK